MNLRDAVDILEVLGSIEDPIRCRGKDTTPRDLLYESNEHMLASEFRISYTAQGCRNVVRGTFRGMIADRMKEIE